MSDPEKLSARLSQATSEIPPGDDLEAMIARLDKKWRDIKMLLRAEEDAALEEGWDSPVGPEGIEPMAAAGTGESWWRSLLPAQKTRVDVTSQESEAIIERVEELDEASKVREQLVKVQWQNRGLFVYALICTIMFLYLLVSIFFSGDVALTINNRAPAREPQLAAGPPAPTSLAAALALGTGAAPMAGEALTSQPRGAGDPGSLQETAARAEISDPSGTAQAPGVPQTEAEYVGSITSHKYHYRSCKWAKFIISRKERVFHSVAEAQRAGYHSCPTCQPPLTDDIQTSAR